MTASWVLPVDRLAAGGCHCDQLNCPGGLLCRHEIAALCERLADDPRPRCTRTTRRTT